MGRMVIVTLAMVLAVLMAVPVAAGAASAEERTREGDASGKTTARATGLDVVREASKYLNVNYGNSVCRASRMVDCSCLTKLVYGHFQVRIPDSPVYQWRYGAYVPRSELRRGDIVFFDMNRDGELNPFDHVGIYAGGGDLIHASSYFGKVVRVSMYHGNKGTYFGARRMPIR